MELKHETIKEILEDIVKNACPPIDNSKGT